MAQAKVTPIGGNILVKAVSGDKTSASGIVLPDTMDKEKPQKGEIIALGSGRISMDGRRMPFSVKVGDIVVFKKYSPDEIEVDGIDYLIMDEESILAVLTK